MPIEAAALGGTVFYFGVPDDDSYPISMRDDAAQQPDPEIRCDARPAAGPRCRRRVRPQASRVAGRLRHPHLRCRRCAGRVRVGLPARRRNASRSRSSHDASRLQEALAAKAQVWGGWVVGPTIIGPEEFAQAGLRLRRIRRPARLSRRRRRRAAVAPAGARPDRDRGAAAVGRSRADRPGPRRRRRRGDHRDGRIGRTGCRRGGRHPVCARRGAQLRAAAGEPRASTPPRSRRGRACSR